MATQTPNPQGGKKGLQVKGGKEIEASNLKGFRDGEKLIAFRRDEFCDFEYNKDSKSAKHLAKRKDLVVKMHVLDAAIAEELGKGKIVPGSEKKYERK